MNDVRPGSVAQSDVPGDLDLTVAICTWNRSAILRETLEHLATSVLPPPCTWELLVVDNASTDDTPMVLEAFRRRLPLRVVRETQPGIGAARNRVLREATTEWIACIDDDVFPETEWAHEVVAACKRHEGATMIGGAVIPWFPYEPEPALVEAFPVVATGFCGLDHGAIERDLSPQEIVVGANLLINRRRLGDLWFDAAKGNRGSAQFGGEETDLQRRVIARGGQVVWSPRVRVKHRVDPRRLRLSYLKRFTVDRIIGDGDVWFDLTGPQVAGVPTWLLQRIASGYWRALVFKLSGNRAAHLRARRDAWRAIAAARLAWQRRHADGTRGGRRGPTAAIES